MKQGKKYLLLGIFILYIIGLIVCIVLGEVRGTDFIFVRSYQAIAFSFYNTFIWIYFILEFTGRMNTANHRYNFAITTVSIGIIFEIIAFLEAIYRGVQWYGMDEELLKHTVRSLLIQPNGFLFSTVILLILLQLLLTLKKICNKK